MTHTVPDTETPLDTQNAPTSHSRHCNPHCEKHCGKRHRRGKRWLFWSVIVVIVGGFAVSKWAHHHYHHGALFLAAQSAERDAILAHFTDKALDKVDANNLQKQQITRITQQTANQLVPLHLQQRALHDKLRLLLTAPTVDSLALEQLRLQEVALFNQASTQISHALLSSANVLTPAQRVQLAKKLKGEDE